MIKRVAHLMLPALLSFVPTLLIGQDASSDSEGGWPRWATFAILGALLVAVAVFSPRQIRIRIGLGLITIVGAIFLILLLLNTGALPDPTASDKVDSVEVREQLREKHGLNLPLFERMFFQVKGMLWDGELMSHRSERNVVDDFWDKFPATVELGLTALLLATFIGVILGIIASVYSNTALDYGAMIVSLIGVSVPVFWLAILLLWAFGKELGWFDFGGGRLNVLDYATLYQNQDGTQWEGTGFLLVDTLLRGRVDLFFQALKYLFLPALALATIPLAMIARMTRSSMLEVLGEDYIRTAKAKGMSRGRTIFVHALRNAAIPIVTLIGLQLGSLFAGAVLTESIFNWDGIGKWIFVKGLDVGDQPVVLVGVSMVVVVFVIINIFVDLLYAWLNPRIRHG